MIEKIKNHFLNQRFKNNIQKSRNENYRLGEKINKIGIKKVYYSVDNDYVNDFIYGQIIKCYKC